MASLPEPPPARPLQHRSAAERHPRPAQPAQNSPNPSGPAFFGSLPSLARSQTAPPETARYVIRIRHHYGISHMINISLHIPDLLSDDPSVDNQNPETSSISLLPPVQLGRAVGGGSGTDLQGVTMRFGRRGLPILVAVVIAL